MNKVSEIDLNDYLTVSQYVKRKRKLTREDAYYYIGIGRLKTIEIGGVKFIHKNEKVQPKKKSVKKMAPSKTQRRALNAKKYLSKIKSSKIN